ncbi:MAG: hypothetical protein KTR27_19040 [Leptolyngbyaceae cyanobacterium MAG.088]|nr:hypothetical protein [Leptolyngbyaceae cyanobacterium MAG.088]
MLIDLQKGFDEPSWGRRNNSNLESNTAQLLKIWRAHHRPVIHVQQLSTEPQSSLRPGQKGCEFKNRGVLPLP